MRASIILSSICYLTVATSSPTIAKDGLSVAGILAMSKLAGACGILNAQIHFQDSTRLDGGEQFISRFWATEATRLGLTVKEYVVQCNQAISGYDELQAVQEK